MGKTAFLFSGQGAQYPGMMKDIWEQNEAARTVFSIADGVLGRGISELCFFGTQEDLNLTHHTQPCVLAADLAAWAAINHSGIQPDAVAGFSLGEYGAMVAAGVISISDIFLLIQKRADYMQEAVPVGKGSMAAVKNIQEEEVLSICEEVSGYGYVIPANFNCPGQIVVSGETGAIDRFIQIAKERKIRTIKLPVSAPFHCGMMDIAAERLKKDLLDIQLSSSSCPVYMNVDGEKEETDFFDKLISQTNHPVRWEQTLRNMHRDGIDTFVEVGPGKTLSGFVKKTLSNVKILNVSDVSSLNDTITELRGGRIDG